MTSPSLALVFPGQGSQKIGMLAEMAAQHPVIQQTFAEASDVLSQDLWALAQAGDQQQLNLTENTQPLLLTASVALWRVWIEQTAIRPALMAGHSLGEFSALVCAGVIAFADAVKLVRQRGQFMQTAVPVGEGSMAAVLGLDDDVIVQICRDASSAGVVEAVNFNSPGQVVIAGQVAAVDKAIALCQDAGAKRALPLAVSAPFHTSLMTPAGEKLAIAMANLSFGTPRIPVVHNVHGRTESAPQIIKQLLQQQISSAVKWVTCVETMVASGVTATVECGPGKVLSGLNKRINKELHCAATETPDDFAKALAAAQGA